VSGSRGCNRDSPTPLPIVPLHGAQMISVDSVTGGDEDGPFIAGDDADTSGWAVTGSAGDPAAPEVGDNGPVQTTIDGQTTLPPSDRLDQRETSEEECGNGGEYREILLRTQGRLVGFRHSGWAGIRRKVHDSLLRTGQSPARREAFATCGSHGIVCRSDSSLIARVGPEAHSWRVRWMYCHDRLCTPCAMTRSMVLREALLKVVDGRAMSLITLTLRGRKEPLNDTIDRLYKSFRSLRDTDFWTEKVKGGAAFLELTRGVKGDHWHVHLHIIADAQFIDKNRLSSLWKGITGDSFIVDIRRASEAKNVSMYVTKYVTKALSGAVAMDAAALDEAVVSLKGRRLCMCFGTWYGTALSRDSETELADDILEAGEHGGVIAVKDLLTQADDGDQWAITIIHAAGLEKLWGWGRPPPTDR
jgi:hypothetical protein